MKRLKSITTISSLLFVIFTSSCSDASLESRLNGNWRADVTYADSCSQAIHGSIELILSTSTHQASLVSTIVGGKCLFDKYQFDGKWNAKGDNLTLNLSSNGIQSYSDSLSKNIDVLNSSIQQIESFNRMAKELNSMNLELPKIDTSKTADISHKLVELRNKFNNELELHDAMHKNVGCISTMNIVDLTDSTLTLGDDNSRIVFKKKY